LLAILKSGALSYGGEISGMEKFRNFMENQNYLRNGLLNEELILP